MKMTIAGQIKTLERKIKQNEVQYDLKRKAVKYLHCQQKTWTNMNI